MQRETRLFLGGALLCLLAAALLHLLVLSGVGRLWPAMVHILLFGWITGMIVGISYHTMPLFSRRDWPAPRLSLAQLAALTGGVAAATSGLALGWGWLTALGLALQLLASVIFLIHNVLLIRQPAGPPRHPPGMPGQQAIDRLATRATSLSGLCLPLALALLLSSQLGWIDGRWHLAAEHLTALGWVMLMVVGVAYHLLPRFTNRAVRGLGWVRAQLGLHLAALLLLVPALGRGWTLAFALSGALMAAALLLFGWTIWPTIGPLNELRQVSFVDQPPIDGRPVVRRGVHIQ